MKALLVDDERLARRELGRLLRAHPQIEIAGEAADADQALVLVARCRPEVLFLDVQMPGRGGFELLEALDDVPAVIFTTAFDAYALRAFEVSAVDYLVKPIVPARLATAIAKLEAGLHPAAPAAAGAVPLAASHRIFVRDGERCWFVRLGEVVLLEAEGNYTRLYFGSERPLYGRSLAYLEERLDAAAFFRASRSQIVNLAAIEKLDPWPNGGLRAKLHGGHEATISRRQAQTFQERMKL